MRKLLNIILFALLSLACRCQEPDTLIYYTQDEVDSILELKDLTIQELASQNTELLTQVDSLILVLEEEKNASSSFIRLLDTAYVYISDNFDNSIEVIKNGSQLNVITAKGLSRISSYYGNERRVYFMDDTITNSSILEDSTGYKMTFVNEDIEITKRK